MYIYRAVRTKGKSLQEDANQLESAATTPSYFLSQTHTQTANTEPLGSSSPQMPEKKATADWAALLRPSGTQYPWLNLHTDTREKVSGSYTASWP